MMLTPVTVDFETEGFDGNPTVDPPDAVGVSIKWPGHASNYFAWGHPTDNNCHIGLGMQALDQVVNSGLPILFHHDAFDVSVWGKLDCRSGQYFRKRRFPWERIHDTMYLLFLADPYSHTLSLKPCAERYLGSPPNERDEVKAWVDAHIPQEERLIGYDAKGKAKYNPWGYYISRAPGSLVGRYAVGDTDRTYGLFELLFPRIVEQGMLDAYRREQKLFPIMLDATVRGIRIDRERLEGDTHTYTQALVSCEQRLCNSIGITEEGLEDEETFKDGLERSGAVKEWTLTPKSGKRSIAAGNLKIVIPEIAVLMEYRQGLKGCLQSFMRPWLGFSAADGRLHPTWNQVRQARDGSDAGTKGARTGRLSADSPSMMNVTTEFEYKDGRPMPVPPGLPPYPLLRQYCLPEVGHVWLKRDFSSQEFRIMAHFEDGAICQAYCANPDFDPHETGRDMIAALVGIQLARRPVKITGFSIIYGTGYNGLAIQLEQPLEAARTLKDAYLKVFPSVETLMKDVQLRGRSGVGIRTWGGRIYYSEPAKEIKYVDQFGNECKRTMDFHYKLLNYLVQGSAADQTKDSICDWNDMRDPEALFLATVHDENNISAPKEDAARHMAVLTRAMEKERFAVPFKTEGFMGPNWHDIEACT